MRLRLTIQRNGLPAANILWSVPDTNSATAYTITRLLEDINLIVPLEAEHWGLEHYVVEVGGFECLHFMPVGQCLKEDDHVSIRPLMRAEIRARTLTGRHQISDGGQHLVDGVPFGRPYLRQPNRPAVRIPPRKRQRLEEITDEEGRLLLETQRGEEAIEAEAETLANGTALVAATPARKSKGAEKTVHFKQPEVEMDLDEDSDEDEDDDDFAPGEESDDVDVDGSDDSESDSESDTDSSDASNTSDSDSSSDDSSSDSDSESDSDAEPEVRSSKKPVPKVNVPPLPTNANISPPGEGKKTTQARNARRTKTNRLNHLKEAGKLHKDADLKDLERYEEEIRLQRNSEQSEPGHSFAQSTGKRKRLETEEQNQNTADEAAELEKRKQEMMAKFAQDSDVTMEEPDSRKTEQSASTLPQQETKESDATPEKAPERKRLRPDVSAIGRMLARQTKNLVKKPVKAKEPTPEPEGSTDPDFWKSRISLSAFECWEEEYELTAPPFPFKQHWDPIGKVMRDAAKARKGKGNKGRKKPAVEEPQEEEEEDEEEKIFLNYDDTPDDNPDVQIHAAIEDQLQQDIATASQEQSADDLPALPEDLNTLPDLTSADIKAGALIVCRFFGVNPVTVTPEISGFKTAVVEQEGDSGAGAGTIRLRIAQRDLPRKEKKFNSKGERIYDAKDGFFMDEEEEEGLWSGMFGELLEGRLLKAA